MMRGFKRFGNLQSALLLHELTYVLLIILTVFTGISWIFAWQNNSQESLRLTRMMTDTQHIRGDLYRQMKEVFDATFLHDPQAAAEYDTYSKTIENYIVDLQQLSRNPEETRQIQRIVDAYDHFLTETRYYLNIETISEKQILLLDKPLEQLTFRHLETAFTEFETYLQDRQSLLSRDQDRWLSQVFWLESVPVMLALMLLIWSRYFVKKQVLSPLSEVMTGAKAIAQGALDHKLPERGLQDLQMLTATINHMASDLAENREYLVEARKQAAMAELIPLVAHNIRNPLAGIRAAAQVTLADDKDLPTATTETLQDMIVAVDRLERWVTSLLMYLHPMQPQFSIGRITQITDNAASLIQLQIKDKQLTLHKSGWSADTQAIAIDFNLLEQAVCNLLQNAIEAAPVNSQIQLKFWRDASQIFLDIEDQGRGIDLLHNGNESTQKKPLHYGLGVPFSRKVLEQHNGTLSHISLESGGTRARIQLPLNQPDNPL